MLIFLAANISPDGLKAYEGGFERSRNKHPGNVSTERHLYVLS